MNISLMAYEAENYGDSLLSDIEEHREIMENAGYKISGPSILLPDDQSQYPGSYQVWTPFWFDEEGGFMFLYVDPDGKVIVMDELPSALILSSDA